MKSFDTNVLFYATNNSLNVHSVAKAFLENALRHSSEFIISDQVYFEYYRLLRNTKLNTRPASAKEASEILDFYRQKSGFLHCSYESRFMKETLKHLSGNQFKASNTFDLILAVTLAKNGVKTFYTRNVKDFNTLGLFEVVNPLV